MMSDCLCLCACLGREGGGSGRRRIERRMLDFLIEWSKIIYL